MDDTKSTEHGPVCPAGELEQEVVALHEAHCGELLSYAGSMMRSPDSAMDAVQEVFLRYFVERSYGRAIDNPRAWLYRVLRNYLLDRIGSAAAQCEVHSEKPEELPDGRQSPEAKASQAQFAQQITAILTPREMECLRLRTEGLSYEEIATVLGVRPGTVSSLLTRSYRKLARVAAGHSNLRLGTAEALYLLLRGESHSS